MDQSVRVDFDARYRVNGMPGVAFRLTGYHVEYGDMVDDFYEGDPTIDPTRVHAVMVGDDREHIVDVDDLVLLAEEDYCSVCGQIGCGHNF